MKKANWAALLALLLMLLAQPALADEGRSMVLPLPDGAVLISSGGQTLTERGAYSSIVSVSGGDVAAEDELFMALPSYDEQASGLALLLDYQGQPMTDPVYEQLIHENGVIRYVQGGLQGVMGRDLAPIVGCNYTVLIPNGEGGYLGLENNPYDDTPNGVYYIDMTGNETATNVRITGSMGDFSEGLCTATSADNGRIGYLDAQGEWAIAPQLEYGGEFKNGRAEACIESGYGVIDMKGNWLLTPKYALVSTGFGDGNIILASQDASAVYLIDPRNYQIKQTFSDEEIYFGAYFDRDYVVLYRTGSVQLIDESGAVLMETVPEGNFDVWYAMGDRVIARRGSWGEQNTYLVDLSGQDIAGPYRDMELLGNDSDMSPYFSFTNDDPDAVLGDEDERSSARSAGVMDQDGKLVIEPGQFLHLNASVPGYLVAETADQIGIISYLGEWLTALPKEGNGT